MNLQSIPFFLPVVFDSALQNTIRLVHCFGMVTVWLQTSWSAYKQRGPKEKETSRMKNNIQVKSGSYQCSFSSLEKVKDRLWPSATVIKTNLVSITSHVLLAFSFHCSIVYFHQKNIAFLVKQLSFLCSAGQVKSGKIGTSHALFKEFFFIFIFLKIRFLKDALYAPKM